MSRSDDVFVEQVLTIAGGLVVVLVAWLFAELAKNSPLVRRVGRIVAVLVLVGLCVFVWVRRQAFLGSIAEKAIERLSTPSPTNKREASTSSPVSAPSATSPPRLPVPDRPPTDATAGQDYPWLTWLPANTPRDHPLVFVVDATGAYDAEVAAAVARPIGGQAGAFAPAFVKSGAFERLFNGDSRLLGTAGRQPHLPDWLLGKSRATYSSQDDVVEGLKRVELTLHLRRYQLSQGTQSSVFPLTVTGTGFSNASALALACDRMSDRIQEIFR